MGITLELSPAVARFLADLVRSGSFSNESEFVGALIEQAWLDRQIAEGKAQADRGEFVETNAEEIIRKGRALLASER
jgi:Arc/MetJ-type ribon-helix-helix transcriptional regulator